MKSHQLKRGEDPNPHDPSTTEANPVISRSEAEAGEKNKTPAQLGREVGSIDGIGHAGASHNDRSTGRTGSTGGEPFTRVQKALENAHGDKDSAMNQRDDVEGEEDAA